MTTRSCGVLLVTLLFGLAAACGGDSIGTGDGDGGPGPDTGPTPDGGGCFPPPP